MIAEAARPNRARVMTAIAIPSAMPGNKIIPHVGAYLLEGGAHG